jgi:RNA ligase (TIGR02306 family)
VPEHPAFEFLRKSHFRVKTVRLRGQISQGILFPTTILPGQRSPGDDVTEIMGVKKYEKPLPGNFGKGSVKGNFPDGVPKTDEERIQNVPKVIEELQGVPCYATVKLDGTSATFAKVNGELHVCSRNLSLNDDGDSVYWRMFRKYDLEEFFAQRDNFAIQAEIVGPGIQGNKLKLTEQRAAIFNMYDAVTAKYLNVAQMRQEMVKHNPQWGFVPIVQFPGGGPAYDCPFDFKSVDELLEFARGEYDCGGPREGIVIRPMEERYSPALRGRCSFKVVNNEYLLKNKE